MEIQASGFLLWSIVSINSFFGGILVKLIDLIGCVLFNVHAFLQSYNAA